MQYQLLNKLLGRYEGLKEAYNLVREYYEIEDDAMIELLNLIDDVEQSIDKQKETLQTNGE